MKIATMLMTLFSTMFVWAQPSFQLSGSYPLQGPIGRVVKFNLEWEEADGKIKGVYSDNYYTRKTPVRGEALDHGRSFLVSFPDPVKGISTVTLLTSRKGEKDTATTVPFSVITRDAIGNPVTVVRAAGQFLGEKELVSMIPPRRGVEVGTGAASIEDAEPCVENFGVLAGFCGSYYGTLVEELDLNNHCALLNAKLIRLTLDEHGTVFLEMDQAQHEIGRIRSDPESRTIEVLNRTCEDLHKTEFPASSCKELHFSGSFSAAMGKQNFTGNYSIQDEATGELCKYGLSMSQRD